VGVLLLKVGGGPQCYVAVWVNSFMIRTLKNGKVTVTIYLSLSMYL